MSIDKFGRYHSSLRGGRKGDPGLGFKLSLGGDYDMLRKRLINVGDPVDDDDAMTLKHYLATKYSCDLKKLQNLADPAAPTDAATKAYVDEACRGACRDAEDKIETIKSDLETKMMNASARIDSVINTIPTMIKNKIASDISDKCLVLNEDGNYDVKRRRLVNVADPQQEWDAINVASMNNIKRQLTERLHKHIETSDQSVRHAENVVAKILQFKTDTENEIKQLKGNQIQKQRDGAGGE